jgi:hypothetical protein
MGKSSVYISLYPTISTSVFGGYSPFNHWPIIPCMQKPPQREATRFQRQDQARRSMSMGSSQSFRKKATGVETAQLN